MSEVARHVAPAGLNKIVAPGSSVTTITLDTSGEIHHVVVSSGVVHSVETGLIRHNASTTFNNTANGAGSSGCPVLVNGALYGAHNGVDGQYNVAWFVPMIPSKIVEIKYPKKSQKQTSSKRSVLSLGKAFFSPEPHVFPQKSVSPVPNPNTVLRGDGSRLWSKATPDQLMMEVQTLRLGRARWNEDEVFYHAMDIFKDAGPYSEVPMTDAVGRKANSRSNSYPFSQQAALYRDLKKIIGDEEDTGEASGMVGMLEEYKKACETEVMQSYYYAAPKADFHSLKKINTGRLRALYMQPLMDFLLSVHLFGNLDFLTKMRREIYCPNLGRVDTVLRKRRLRGKYAFGLDFTAWDKSITVDLIVPILRALCVYSHIDPYSCLGQWVMNTYAFPHLVVPLEGGGHQVLQMNGGNPSGGHLTTFLGCVAHEVVYRMAPGSGHVQVLICSDDSVYSSEDPFFLAAFCNTYRNYLESHHIEPKFDLLDGKSLFPPGAFPPFLSKVEDWKYCGTSGDQHVLIPANPRRAVVGLSVFPANYATSKTDRDLYESRLVGVYNEIHPAMVDSKSYPKIYTSVVEEMRRLHVPVRYPSALRNVMAMGE
jgi:hypothetical protein